MLTWVTPRLIHRKPTPPIEYGGSSPTDSGIDPGGDAIVTSEEFPAYEHIKEEPMDANERGLQVPHPDVRDPRKSVLGQDPTAAHGAPPAQGLPPSQV